MEDFPQECIPICHVCHSERSKICCEKCATPYCSKRCQKKDWNQNCHKRKCDDYSYLESERVGTNLVDLSVYGYVFDRFKVKKMTADLKEAYKKYCQYQTALQKPCEPFPILANPRNGPERKIYINSVKKYITHFKSMISSSKTAVKQ